MHYWRIRHFFYKTINLKVRLEAQRKDRATIEVLFDAQKPSEPNGEIRLGLTGFEILPIF